MENPIEQDQLSPEKLEIVHESSNESVEVNKEAELLKKYQENFSELAAEEMLTVLEEIKAAISIPKLKNFFDSASKAFKQLYEKEKEVVFTTFIAEGGKEEDFKYQSPIQDKFRDLFQAYKKQRANYYQQMEANQLQNFEDKKAIVEQLKALIDRNESTSFQDFKELQEKWKGIGNVPSKDADNLYKNFHHHVDRFFDLLNLDRELREVEFRRNLKKKEDLCIAAEALLEREDFYPAFEELQGLHRIWKEEVGAVAKEFREDVWNRFQEATKIMHSKRHALYEAQKVEMEIHFSQRLVLVEKVKSIDITKLESHKDWQEQIQEINALREEWKTIGHLNKTQSQESWNLFIAAIKEFNHHKNEFYKLIKSRQKDALKIKQSILEKAESLKESEDWKGTAEKLKDLQKDWKNSPKPYSKDADVIWEKFRGACNHFFDRRSAHFDGMMVELKDNYTAKKSLLDEFNGIELGEDSKADLQLLAECNKRWKAIGSVPREHKNEIDNGYKSLMDSLYGKLRLDEKEKRQIQFKMKIESILANDNADYKIQKERQFLRSKIDQLNKELKQYENNRMMISGGDNNPFYKEVDKLIQKHQRQIDTIREDLKLIKSLESSND